MKLLPRHVFNCSVLNLLFVRGLPHKKKTENPYRSRKYQYGHRQEALVNPPLVHSLSVLSVEMMNAFFTSLKAKFLGASKNLLPGTTDLHIERCVVFTVFLSGNDSKNLNKVTSLFSQLP